MATWEHFTLHSLALFCDERKELIEFPLELSQSRSVYIRIYAFINGHNQKLERLPVLLGPFFIYLIFRGTWRWAR